MSKGPQTIKPASARKPAQRAQPARKGPKKKRTRTLKTTPAQLKRAANTIEAVKLRRQGLQYDEIGQRLGCSPKTAHEMVTEWLKKLAAETREQSETLRAIELRRLDALYEAMESLALKGSPKATMACVNISKRRTALLGLDKQKVEIDVSLKGYAVHAASPDAWPDPPRLGPGGERIIDMPVQQYPAAGPEASPDLDAEDKADDRPAAPEEPAGPPLPNLPPGAPVPSRPAPPPPADPWEELEKALEQK